MSDSLLFVFACAGLAILYGIFSYRWILAKPAGNPRMQEIAGSWGKAVPRAPMGI